MLSKNQIKHLRSLHQKKFRQKYDIFIAEGDKVVRELLLSRKYRVQGIYALEKWIIQNAELMTENQSVTPISERELKAISLLKTPNQVFVVAEKPTHAVNLALRPDDFVLFLDHLQDPGNVGTIVRIADWFGIRCVIASPDSADFYSPKVVQASMGSLFRVPTIQMSFSEMRNMYPAWPIYATTLSGTSIYGSNMRLPGILAIGNESRGLRSEVLEDADHHIAIPSFGSNADSLNAAVTAGICCAFIRGQTTSHQ